MPSTASSDKSLAGRMPGVHLTEEGRAQAARLAEHFAGPDVGRILSSPLERCLETADPDCRTRLVWRCKRRRRADRTRLRRMDRAKASTISSDDPRWHRWNTEREHASIPGGESMGDVRSGSRRCSTVSPRERQGPPSLSATAMSSRPPSRACSGLPLNLHDRLQIDPASITTLDLWPGGGKIVRMNEEAAA